MTGMNDVLRVRSSETRGSPVGRARERQARALSGRGCRQGHGAVLGSRAGLHAGDRWPSSPGPESVVHPTNPAVQQPPPASSPWPARWRATRLHPADAHLTRTC